MSEKVIKFPGTKIERPEDIFKVGVHVNLKNNFQGEYDKGNIFYTLEINNRKFVRSTLLMSDMELIQEAYGLTWEITETDFRDDKITITREIYGKVIKMAVSPHILRVSNKAIDKKG